MGSIGPKKGKRETRLKTRTCKSSLAAHGGDDSALERVDLARWASKGLERCLEPLGVEGLGFRIQSLGFKVWDQLGKKGKRETRLKTRTCKSS